MFPHWSQKTIDCLSLFLIVLRLGYRKNTQEETTRPQMQLAPVHLFPSYTRLPDNNPRITESGFFQRR